MGTIMQFFNFTSSHQGALVLTLFLYYRIIIIHRIHRIINHIYNSTHLLHYNGVQGYALRHLLKH